VEKLKLPIGHSGDGSPLNYRDHLYQGEFAALVQAATECGWYEPPLGPRMTATEAMKTMYPGLKPTPTRVIRVLPVEFCGHCRHCWDLTCHYGSPVTLTAADVAMSVPPPSWCPLEKSP